MITGTIALIDIERPFYVNKVDSGRACLRMKMVEVLCDNRKDIIDHNFEIGQEVVITIKEKE